MTAAAAAVLLLALLMAATGLAGTGGGPRVIQLSYSRSDDGSTPHTVLQAFARRTKALRFSTAFHGRRASAPARFNSHVTDTDLHGQASHPWELEHGGPGGRVYELVRRSLAERRSAAVRVRARRGDRVDRVKLKIRVSKCAKDPPFYPLDCTIHR